MEQEAEGSEILPLIYQVISTWVVHLSKGKKVDIKNIQKLTY